MKKLEKEYIFYLRHSFLDHNDKEYTMPVGTVAVKSLDDGTLKAALAVCSGMDIFSKRIGRKIATGRLNRHRENTPGIVVGKDPDELVNEIYVELSTFKSHRRQARNGSMNLHHIDPQNEGMQQSLDVIENLLNKRLGIQNDSEGQTPA